MPWDVLGSVVGGIFNANEGKQNRRWAEEQNATKLQTLVKDAKKAGISPLAALGSAGASSPVPGISGAGDNLGAAVSGLGDIGKGRNAKGNQKVLDALTIKRARLENELIEGQIKQQNQSLIQSATSRSTAPTEPSTTERTANQVFDTHSMDPQRIQEGPFEGHYLAQFGDTLFVSDGRSTPPGAYEDLGGELGGEALGALQNAGFFTRKVYIDPKDGIVKPLKTKEGLGNKRRQYRHGPSRR